MCISRCKRTYRPHTERQKEKNLKPKLKIRKEEEKKKSSQSYCTGNQKGKAVKHMYKNPKFFNFASFFLVSFLYSYFSIKVPKHCQTYFLLFNISQSIKLYKCIKHLSILHTACPHYNTVMGSNELNVINSHIRNKEKSYSSLNNLSF